MPYKEPPKSGRTTWSRKPDQDGKAPWATYLGGSWRREHPTRPGLYPIATREGTFAGYREWVTRRIACEQKADGTTSELLCVDALAPMGRPELGWSGWVWSVPLPEPPRAAADWYAISEALPPAPSELTVEAKVIEFKR